MELTAAQIAVGRAAVQSRQVSPKRVLSSLYGFWMRSAAEEVRSGAIATNPIKPFPIKPFPIKPFAHQDATVDRMLAQARLRFWLGDEPGTGKTIMTGLYIVEARRKHWSRARC